MSWEDWLPKRGGKTEQLQEPSEDLALLAPIVEAAELLKRKNDHEGDKRLIKIISDMTWHAIRGNGEEAREALDVGSRELVDRYFSWKENYIRGKDFSNTINFTESGKRTAKNTVMYIPGMFDDSMEERTRILERNDVNRQSRNEYWVSADTLYSARDVERIRAIIDELESKIIERIELGGRVVLIGYSCGGLIGKVLADRLSEKYPNRIGLIVHHAPLDGDEGWLVEHSSVKELQAAIGFINLHGGDYPFIPLGGKDDIIVTCKSCVMSTEGNPIKIKRLHGGHPVPIPGLGITRKTCLDHPKAARRVAAAIRNIESYLDRRNLNKTRETVPSA